MRGERKGRAAWVAIAARRHVAAARFRRSRMMAGFSTARPPWGCGGDRREGWSEEGQCVPPSARDGRSRRMMPPQPSGQHSDGPCGIAGLSTLPELDALFADHGRLPHLFLEAFRK